MRTDMLIPQAQDAQNRYSLAADRSYNDYERMQDSFSEFAKTGGYSPLDMANMRARGVAPIRSLYANANRDVNRQASLQGGYSPGMGTLKARMAREMSSGMSDASTNVEGQLAQLKNQGKQFGLSGGSNLYGTSPGLASHFGGMQNQAMNNWLQAQGLQQQLGLGTMNAQIAAGGIKGTGQQAYENVITGINTASNVAKPLGGGK